MDPTSLKHFVSKYPFQELFDSSGAATGQFVSCPVRLAFVAIEKPRVKDSGKSVYSLSALIPAGVDVAIARKVAGACAAEKFGHDKWQKLANAGALKMPIKKQDANATGANLKERKYDGFEVGSLYFDASRSADIDPPAIVDGNLAALPASAIYSGCWARLRLRAYAYEAKGNQGISFGLVSVQKIADDEKFAGNVDSTEAFGVVEHAGGTAAANGAAAAGTGAAADMNW